MLVSSGKWYVLEYFLHLRRSFRYVSKGNGPNAKACGTRVDVSVRIDT